jgi:hypothetical protein
MLVAAPTHMGFYWQAANGKARADSQGMTQLSHGGHRNAICPWENFVCPDWIFRFFVCNYRLDSYAAIATGPRSSMRGKVVIIRSMRCWATLSG